MNLLLIAIKFQGFSNSPLAPCVACPVWELLTQMCAGDVVVLLMAAQRARLGSSRHFTNRSGGRGSPVGGACWVPAGWAEHGLCKCLRDVGLGPALGSAGLALPRPQARLLSLLLQSSLWCFLQGICRKLNCIVSD